MGKSVGKLWRPSNHFYVVKSHVFFLNFSSIHRNHNLPNFGASEVTIVSSFKLFKHV